MVILRLAAVLAALALASCKPDLGARASLVTGPRILAVRAEPPEGPEKSDVALSLLAVDVGGEVVNPQADWAFCNQRKPLSELEPVSPTCLSANDVPLGTGPNTQGRVPDQACRFFGPQVPPPKMGEPFGRPVDPDPTGGYYQPIRVSLLGLVAVAADRVACGITGASPTDIQDFNARYKLNRNPEITSLTIAGAEAMRATVAVNTTATIAVSWPDCPGTDPAECTGAEHYLQYDIEQQHNVVRREAMRVSWFVTGGTVSADRSGRAEDDFATNASTDFTPDKSAVIHGWAVLRDDRGGLTWRAFELDVP